MSSLESPRPILAYASRQYPIIIASIAGVICRFVINNGAPLMIVQDLLRALGYKDNRTSDLRKIFDTNQRVHRRNFDELIVKLPFGRWGITAINEDGLRLACDLVKPDRTQELCRWLEDGGMQHISEQAGIPTAKGGVNAVFEHADAPTKSDGKTCGAARFEQEGKCLADEAFEKESAKCRDDETFAARIRRKEYCRELCRIIARYADDAESIELARALEGVAARILARRYCPGLNAASYDVFARLGMKGGAR